MSFQSGKSRKRKRRSRSPEDSAARPPLQQLGASLEVETPLDALLLKAVDACFIFLILVLPFIMAGREAPGQLALVCVASCLAGCWGLLQIRQRESRWIVSWVEPLFLAGIALVVLQVVRLPPDQLARLSPKLGELLTTWNGESGLPVWNQLSFMPAETLDSLMVFLAYGMIFIVALQRIRTQADAYRLMTLLATATVAMAIFALLQYAASNGKFFWFYENPFTHTERIAKGAFTNRNHFCNFMAIGIGPLLFCLTLSSLKSKPEHVGFSEGTNFATYLIATTIAFVVFAGLLSLSRGGAIAMGVAAVVAGFALYRSSALSGQLVFAGVCVMLLTCGLIAVYGEEQITKRFDEIASADVEELDAKDGRRAIWAANLAGIREFPLVGTGIGTHREVYPMYMEDSGADYRDEFTHAENGYLQVALESGGVGFGLLMLAFCFALLWTLRGLGRKDNPKIAAAQAASLAAILASLVHSAVDFVWYVPACVIPVLLLSASACRLGQLQKEESGRTSFSLPLPRMAWGITGLAVVFLAAWMLPAKYNRMQAEHHWYSYLRMSLKEATTANNASNLLRNRLVAVSRAVQADPTQARPHARLAALYLRIFHELQLASENRMSLTDVRASALSTSWESPDEMHEWLGRVFEDRGEYLTRALAHTKRSLELCPLEGRTYLYLAELDFLDRTTDWNADLLVKQAIQVRPHEPKVLFAFGRQKLIQGEREDGIELWKRAFKLSRDYQTAIIGQLAHEIDAPSIVQTFDPDVAALAHLADRYRLLRRWRDLGYSLNVFANRTLEMADDSNVADERKVRYLLAARKACDELRDEKRALLCFQKAAEIDPRDFRVFYQHGVWLAEREKFVEASEQFQRCAEIRPGDDHVRRMVLTMRKKDLDVQLQRNNTRLAAPQFRDYQ